MTSGWSEVATIRASVRRRWDDQSLLRAYAAGDPMPVIDLPVRRPTPSQIGTDLRAVREWATRLRDGACGGRHYTLSYAIVGGRTIGRNRLPDRVTLTSYEQAWSFLGVLNEVRTYDAILVASQAYPQVQAKVRQQPLAAIRHHDTWPQLLAAYAWLLARSDPPGQSPRYLREIDAPGVDTKFVEQHRSALADLLGIRRSASGFVADAGLRSKPEMIRMRCAPGFLGMPSSVSDVSFRVADISSVRVAVQCAVIVENEISFLSLPIPPEGVIIWGKGFDVVHAGQLRWLDHTPIHYWGDLDTHGFAILDRLRAWHPQTRSFLMDTQTLLHHEDRWGREPTPTHASLSRLDDAESVVYQGLVSDRWAPCLRLEQERIDWAWVTGHLSYD